MQLLIAIALIGLAMWYCSRLGRSALREVRNRGQARSHSTMRKQTADKEALGRWENEGGATAAHTSRHE